MISIQASKQVGPLYYMVKDAIILVSIMNQGVIRTSLKAEPQHKGGSKYHYISFMRDLSKANRNTNRWVYGIQIDGDKLSDQYKISPFSFAGNAIEGNNYRLKTLTAYDDGSYKVNIVNWPPIDVPKFVFDELENLIHSDPQLNEIKKLQVEEGSRSYRGKRALVRYNYNVKTGGPILNTSTLSAKVVNYLLDHTNLNESEERIWVIDENVKYIDISSCVTGYISPRGDESVDAYIDEGLLPDHKIIYY